MNRIWLPLLLSLFLATGMTCAGPAAGTPPPKPGDTPTPQPTGTPPAEPTTSEPRPSPAPGSASVPPEAAKPLEASKKDLARRLGISADEVSLVSVEKVDWPDTSLGCPEPGKVYAQVITPGYRIVLQAKGQTYRYHTDRGQNVVLCEKR